MKSKICKAVFLLHLCFGVSAKENFVLKNYVSIGAKHSSIQESVLQSSVKTSELNWNTIIAPSFTDEFSLELYSFNLSLGFSTVVPVKTGCVEDRDWLFSNKSLLSNYSFHENFIDKDYSVYIKGSYAFSLFSNRLLVNPGIGVIYSNEKYSAKNGYYQYSLIENKAVDSDTAKTVLCGTIMSYEISAFLPECFIDANLKLNEKNSIFLSFDFFPYMIVDSVDTHILRLAEFYDSMKGGFGINLKAGYGYKVSRKIELDFSAAYSILAASGISGSRTVGENTSIVKDEDIQSGFKKSCFEVKFGFLWNVI